MQFFLFLYLSSCRFPYAMSYSVQSIALTFCIRVSRCLSFPDLAQHVPKHVLSASRFPLLTVLILFRITFRYPNVRPVSM
ncbi:hypothetical protein BDP27DRAFT_511178 [Rhodocollybia butyracea]|uniref:Uncharacterized protein n=1 Tax=Rhodocollybia butyracea TaxID=206335 RepID=A0A9P5Q0B1_9AGAR|nr:hypothetical protein BDP27DRAFT_511178 [Rhodocollybia butyracea]